MTAHVVWCLASDHGPRARVDCIEHQQATPGSCQHSNSFLRLCFMLAVLVGWVCLVWYLVILFVCGVGYVQMYAALHKALPVWELILLQI